MLAAAADLKAAEGRTNAALAAAAKSGTSELATARAEEAALEQSIEAANNEIRQLKEKAVPYELIKKESEASQQVFRGLAVRAREAGRRAGFEVNLLSDYCRSARLNGLVVGFGGVTDDELDRALAALTSGL